MTAGTTDIVADFDDFHRKGHDFTLIPVPILGDGFVFSTLGVKIMTHITSGPVIDGNVDGPVGGMTHRGG
ncbi:hypothetical protein [Brevibacterium permense]|uniref:Uncharacterized protein n=1 Tax=Brevibacterium permense TaxID=234834 RepID=A0ABN2A4Z7_9MICO|nr:hypothetical protein [Brevibacterium permense]